MLAVDLSDARRETIEHVSLGADEAGEVGPRLLPFLDVDRIARDSRGAHRHFDDAHHSPCAGDRGGNRPAHRLPLLVVVPSLSRCSAFTSLSSTQICGYVK